ncbi:MAG: glycosyltransferase [Bacteroidetes bacterium]|nr:glycosyltransferase [Bacteroidota bacterium]
MNRSALSPHLPDSTPMLKKADLHIHSKYSDQPSEWLLRQIGAPESYTEPDFLYRTAKRRGMDFVTITDHDTINGVLDIAHHPDVFISVEVTTWFPEDGCAIHVPCYGITEKQFATIQYLRENVYELLAWLRQEQIVHACAHPLYDVAGKLSMETFEKCLLLFDVLEVANGQSNAQENRLIREVATSINPLMYEQLKDMHPRLPLSPAGWRKGYTGGSDDHSGLFIARGYTYAQHVSTPQDFIRAIGRGETDATTVSETSVSFAHGLYFTVFSYYKNQYFKSGSGKADISKALSVVGGFVGDDTASISFRDKVTYFINRLRKKKSQEDFKQYLMTHLVELNEAWNRDENILDPQKNLQLNQQTFEVASYVFNQLVFRFATKAIKKVSEGSIFGSIQSLSSLIPLMIGLIPYFISFLHYNKNKPFHREVSRKFLGKELPGEEHPKKAWVTDTFEDVNGVAVVIRKMAEIGMKHQHELVIVTCTNEAVKSEGLVVKNFKPVGDFKLPQNDTFTLAFPPFLEMVQYFEREGFTEVIISTPGTVGVAAMWAARLLNLKISMIYHTDFPGYVRYYTNDRAMEDIAWKFMLWFYNQADVVHVPSSHYRSQLLRKGLPAEKMTLFPHGTDIDAFTPAKRTPDAFKSFGLNGEKKVIYIGRVAREKDLDLIPKVWKKVHKAVPDAALVIVGDGPYLKELKSELKGEHAVFTGFMKGEDLYRSFASGDVFLFPSTTDTFGNVVLESLASGVPAVVSNVGGPKDIVIHGETGMVTGAKDVDAMAAALIELLKNDQKRRNMSRKAREYAETQSWERIYLNFWNHRQEPARLPEGVIH